jgi:DNA invertase Pin-like site-specific DNA recombinase
MTYYAYIRVSTTRQGQEGVSLQEQRAAITSYAARERFSISAWFEEQQTAAKAGRPIFNHMVGLLKSSRSPQGRSWSA